MRRRGEQKGSVRLKNGRWYGAFAIYGPDGSMRTTEVALGAPPERTKEQAQALLLRVIDKRNNQAGLLEKLATTALTELKPPAFNESAGAWAKSVAAESFVIADLVGRGYMVFRPVVPMGDFDLLYIEGEKPVRVEVKWVGKSDAVHLRHRIAPNLGKFDVIALVHPSGKIDYRTHSDVAWGFCVNPARTSEDSEVEIPQ